MVVEDILCQYDFTKLLKEDIENIKSILNFELDKVEDEESVLFNSHLDTIFNNDETKKIIEQRVFAGITSVNWYIFNLDEDEKMDIKQNIERKPWFDSQLNISTKDIEKPKIYTCIKNNNNYIFRILYPSGEKTVKMGTFSEKVKQVKNIIAILNLEESYLEIRSDSRSAGKVSELLFRLLNINNNEEVLLENFNNNIESFKDSLNEGKFTNYNSTPDYDVDLSDEQSEKIVRVFELLDDYFINKDESFFIEEIREIDLDVHSITFSQLLLAGMEKIGLNCRTDLDKDLTSQSLYNTVKGYVNGHSAYISFKVNGSESKIQIGFTTNSITFRKSATEDEIDYIRNKLLM